METSSSAHISIPAKSEPQSQPGVLRGSFSLQERAIQVKLCHQKGDRETGHDSLDLDEGQRALSRDP